jgi:hypothetical protein
MDSTTSAAELADLRAWRAASASRLSPPEITFLSDATLLRYLRARGSVKKACAALNNTLQWRLDHCSRPPTCAMCESDWGAHCFMGVGWSASRFPVVYGSVPRAANYDPEPAVHHFAQTLEKVFAHDRSGERFIWIFDMKGYTMRHVSYLRDCNKESATV